MLRTGASSAVWALAATRHARTTSSRKVRHELHLDAVPMGPSPDHNDNMILDFHNGVSASGCGHPSCKGGTQADNIS